MKLRFCNPEMVRKFSGLVRRHGFSPSIYDDTAGWQVVETAIDGKEKRALMHEWAEISLVDETKTSHTQRKLL